MRSPLLLTSCLASSLLFTASVVSDDLARESEQHGDIEVGVVLDAAEQAGNAHAIVRMHASQELVWKLITSCQEALKLVPGLEVCKVLESAPDGSWQRIRHVLNYSWYVPKLTYEVLVTYDKPTSVYMERTAGDLQTLQVTWHLSTEGADTIAGYSVDLAPGFWVPHWIVRVALRRDLPKMLRALRASAESSLHP